MTMTPVSVSLDLILGAIALTAIPAAPMYIMWSASANAREVNSARLELENAEGSAGSPDALAAAETSRSSAASITLAGAKNLASASCHCENIPLSRSAVFSPAAVNAIT